MSNPQQLSYNFTRRAVLRIQKTRRKGYYTCDELSGGFHSDILAFCSRLLKPQTGTSVRGLKRRSGGGSALRLIKKSKQAIQSLLRLGAEGGIRTLAPVSRSTPLAGEPLIATWVLLQVLRSANDSVVGEKGGGESGIRTHGSCESLVFKTSSLNHSDISPSLFHRANVILP